MGTVSITEVALMIGANSPVVGAKTARELAVAEVVQAGGEMAQQEVQPLVLVKLFKVAA